MSYIFTSESVSEGHPDKICDQISDAILDECIKQDKHSRVACETMIKNNHVIVGGEITSKADINYKEVAESVIKDIGYDNKEMGFSHESINFKNLSIRVLSPISSAIAAINPSLSILSSAIDLAINSTSPSFLNRFKPSFKKTK